MPRCASGVPAPRRASPTATSTRRATRTTPIATRCPTWCAGRTPSAWVSPAARRSWCSRPGRGAGSRSAAGTRSGCAAVGRASRSPRRRPAAAALETRLERLHQAADLRRAPRSGDADGLARDLLLDHLAQNVVVGVLVLAGVPLAGETLDQADAEVELLLAVRMPGLRQLERAG